MPKELIGKTHVGELREKRPNGDVYVYERITAYDPNTKRTRTIAEHLQGKIKAGTEELVPTRPKRPKGQAGIAPGSVAVRSHTGLTDILEWAGQASASLTIWLVSSCDGTLKRLRTYTLLRFFDVVAPLIEQVL